MIVEWLMTVSAGFTEWVASLMPDWDPPGWMTDPLGPVVTGIGAGASMGAWVDWTAVGVIVGTTTLVFAIAFGIKLVRAILSYVPLIGGAG